MSAASRSLAEDLSAMRATRSVDWVAVDAFQGALALVTLFLEPLGRDLNEHTPILW